MWFGRPKRRTAAPVRFPEDTRQAWQAEDMSAALQIPEHLLPDTADVSAGSRGYSLHALERAGLMRIERLARSSPTETGGWRFTPTPRALERRAAQTPLRLADQPSDTRRSDDERNQGQAEEGQGSEAERLPAEPQGAGRPAVEEVAASGPPDQERHAHQDRV